VASASGITALAESRVRRKKSKTKRIAGKTIRARPHPIQRDVSRIDV
jgi:hypothetical protein